MGIPSLKSAILYKLFSLYFTIKILRYRSGWQSHAQNDRVTLRMTPKSCKYNHRPRKRAYLCMANELIFDSSAKKRAVFLAAIRSFPFPSTKTALFMDSRLIFPFPSTKSGIFMDGRWKKHLNESWLYSHQVRVWWKIFPYLARSPLRVKGIW